MRCPECAERNSVAARKCEFCGNKFKKKPFPLGLKLACGGVAVAITASLAASYLVPRLVDPEESLGRVAKTLAAGPKSVEQANKIKTDFGTAVKNFLKTSGTDKAPELTASLQKQLPSSAFEVHVVDLPRGLRVVEVDTVLQATSFLVMKTSSGTKVFDLPGFEVFDDARILNDSAGPVLALIGHTSGPPPHKPMVRTYALLPDYIADETSKLVPPFKVDGTAKFVKNGQDVAVEFTIPAPPSAKKKVGGDRLAFGTLKWKDARYVSDFTSEAALAAAHQPKQSVAVAAAGAPAVLANGPAPRPVAAPAAVATPLAATATSAKVPPTMPPMASSQKIVVRSFTAADAARSGALNSAARTSVLSDSVLAAVPIAAPALNNARHTVESVTKEFKESKKTVVAAPVETQAPKPERTSSRSSSQTAEVICSGATLRARPTRGANAMNNFGRGTQVRVLGREGDWYHVRVNGQEGYIFHELVSVGTSKVSTSTATVASAAAVSSSSSRSSRSSRRRRHSQEAVLVADSTPVRHKSRSSRRQVATAEPILVP